MVHGPVANDVPLSPNGNAPFDIRIRQYGSIGYADGQGRGVGHREINYQRGYIQTNTQAVNGYGDNPPSRFLYFLYNPSTFSTSYSMQTDPGAVVSALDQGAQGKYIGTLTQNLSFKLLFDRTYEVMDGSREGAWRDVRAALALVGVLNNVDESAMYTTGSDFDAGPMIYTPVYVHFGNQTGGMTFYGYITDLSIEYTNFSKDMVPIRVGMAINVNLLPTGSQRAGESGTTQGQEETGEINENDTNDETWEVDPEILNRLNGGAAVPNIRIWN